MTNLDAGIISIILLLFAVIILRISATASRHIGHWALIIFSDWFLNPVSAWLLVSALGGYAPIWPALMVGIIGSLLSFWKKKINIDIGIDILNIFLLGFLSIPKINVFLLIIAAIVWATFVILIKISLRRFPKKAQLSCSLAPILIVAVIGIGWKHILLSQIKMVKEYFPYIGITFSHRGDRIVLDTGAIGWLDRSNQKSLHDAALFFHGANPEGARQPAAIILRRALKDAGYTILSIDNIGFGETPVPKKGDHISKWDPLPNAISALKTLKSINKVDKVIIMGHSMGTNSVVWLLGKNPEIKNAVIFGGGIYNKKSDSREIISEYWYNRFHSDRKMKYKMSKKELMSIKEKYSTEAALKTLKIDHAPTLFVYFGHEWQNLLQARQNLYESIPGRKKIWHLNDSTHYFSSKRYRNFIIGDTRIAKRVSNRMKLLRQESF